MLILQKNPAIELIKVFDKCKRILVVTLCDKLEDLWTLSICHNKTFYAKECWEVRLGFLKGMCCIWPVRWPYKSLRSDFLNGSQSKRLWAAAFIYNITDVVENKKKWWNCSLTRKKVPFKGHILDAHHRITFQFFYGIFSIPLQS